MKIYLLGLIVLFYVFFFARAYLLSRNTGKSIKTNSIILNVAILFAAITSILFVIQQTFPQSSRYFLLIYSSNILDTVGAVFISFGLVLSTIASLNLGNSWRIGVNDTEKTDLVTTGIYKFSRNPYFLSYDAVLVGLAISTLSAFVIVSASITIVLFHALILKEEKYLESQHGDEYRGYKKQVRRYI